MQPSNKSVPRRGSLPLTSIHALFGKYRIGLDRRRSRMRRAEGFIKTNFPVSLSFLEIRTHHISRGRKLHQSKGKSNGIGYASLTTYDLTSRKSLSFPFPYPLVLGSTTSILLRSRASSFLYVCSVFCLRSLGGIFFICSPIRSESSRTVFTYFPLYFAISLPRLSAPDHHCCLILSAIQQSSPSTSLPYHPQIRLVLPP